jgi:homoserine kinase type II
VLRAWPPDGPSRGRLQRIHDWLAETTELGFVPVPLQALEGSTIQTHAQRLWELSPWLPGQSVDAPPPDPERLRDALRGLASFHDRLARHGQVGTSPGLLRRVEEMRGLMATGLDRLDSAMSDALEDAHWRAGGEWISLARAVIPRLLTTLADAQQASVPLQPCLRDARGEHFLFVEKSLTGIVDFGAMEVETVAADLARLLADWSVLDPSARSGALAFYQEVRSLDPRERRLMDAFEAVADVLIAGHWLAWHFLHRRRFDDPEAIDRGITRGLARLRRRAELLEAPGLRF